MTPEPSKITLSRQESKRLPGKVWVRTWTAEEGIPEWFSHGLKSARPALGYGVIEPLELRITKQKLITVSTGEGRTLAEELAERTLGFDEETARGLVEQLCFALLRVHNQKKLHGGLIPFNIHFNEEKRFELWSVPVARLELSYGALDPDWEVPYRSPQLRDGLSTDLTEDIYSLGKILLRLLCRSQEEFLKWEPENPESLVLTPPMNAVLERCFPWEPTMRFQSVTDLALALNPGSDIAKLDLDGSREDRALAEKAFREGRTEDALAHWTDARRKDWLELTVHNNLAVSRIIVGEWQEALQDLERAEKLYPYHPLVDCNFGFCHYKMRDLSAADYRLKRACTLNPGFAAPFKRLADIALGSGHPESALKFALNALAAAPNCRESRLLTATTMALVGDRTEAEHHQAYAEKLPETASFLDHLIMNDTQAPWAIVLGEHDSSILGRLGVDPRGPFPAHRYLSNLKAAERQRALSSLFQAKKASHWKAPWKERLKSGGSADLPVARLVDYIHPFGEIGVLLEMRCQTEETAESEEFQKLSRDIAQQIAVMNPTYISRNEVSAELFEGRLQKERLAEEGPVSEQLAWGRTERFFESQCLLDQPYFEDYSKTVEAHLREARLILRERIAVARFVRFELGSK